jgi:6-phosphogluconolactonase
LVAFDRKRETMRQVEPLTTDGQIILLPDPEAVAHEAAARWAQIAQEAVESRGRFSAALPGGSTPERLYRLLAEPPYQAEIPWPRVHLFWGDERCVPHDHPDSNFRLADELFLSRVAIPADNVHRVPGELGPRAAAREYGRTLEDYFCGPHARFDLVLLGLGLDGHTASLFPGSPALQERRRLAVAVEAEYQGRPADRVTLTLPVINSARHVFLLVTGSDKAGIVQAVLEGPAQQLPAQRVAPGTGELVWLLDAAAASQLASYRPPPGDKR